MLVLGFRTTLDSLTVEGILVLAVASLVIGGLVGVFLGMMVGFRVGQRDGRRAAELHRREHWVDLIEESVARRSDREDRRRAGPSRPERIERTAAPER